ncbi:Purine nucleoside phosphorylase [Nakaseomyces bracarensis]|uniref:Purine nucleoside phosphorylase n=1 Tax=Nakaseomyces bracarensis TaxID=273131 RepID=A0ABR4NPZ0_9SACH
MSNWDIDEERAKIAKASEYLASRFSEHFKDGFMPKALIICGSGLSGIPSKLSTDVVPLSIPYDLIPGFKKSTVPGHSGNLIFGYMSGYPVVLMSGRLHGYEGNTMQETVFPIRALHHFSKGVIKTLIVTNAAGGVNPEYKPGDMMCIYDHINFPGLAGQHPLKGPNFDETGPRFLALSDAYSHDLRRLLFNTHKELNMDRLLHEGTYFFASGPTFESRAESRMIQILGGDAVGMSTVPEVIVARHCNWKVLALSLITNAAVVEHPASGKAEAEVPIEFGKASHSEVLETGKVASQDVETLIAAVIGKLPK